MSHLYGYALVADPAEPGRSFDDQEAAIKRYFQEQPLGVGWGGVFSDRGARGRLAERQAGSELVSRLRHGDHVAAVDLVALFLTLKDAAQTADALAERGVVVHLIGERVRLDAGPGKLYAAYLAKFEATEGRMESLRMSQQMATRKARGKSRGGNPPMGKRYEGPAGRKKLVDDDRELAAMARIVRLVDVEGKSLNEVWRLLLRAKVKTGGGRPWSRSRIWRAYKLMKERTRGEEADERAEAGPQAEVGEPPGQADLGPGRGAEGDGAGPGHVGAGPDPDPVGDR